MRCYQCGRRVGAGKYCLHCGADLTIYRKIIRLSNRYYNLGLEKANVKDLTGAAEALTRALEIDKHNTQARNLLGLVWYQRGEVVDALCQWVISTGDEKENNPAVQYVQELDGNKTAMDAFNQGLHHFNVALEHARTGNEDLAIIELQSVAREHPGLLKARELLALLYFHAGELGKAEKECKAVLRVDRGSAVSLRLAREITAKRRQGRRQDAITEERDRLREQVEDVKEKAQDLWRTKPAFWLRFVLGIGLLALVLFGILRPTIERRRAQAVSDAISSYQIQLEDMRRGADASAEQAAAYEILLQMSRLDPENAEERAQLEDLFEELGRHRVFTELYEVLYTYWDNELRIPLPTEEATEPAPEENAGEGGEGTGV